MAVTDRRRVDGQAGRSLARASLRQWGIDSTSRKTLRRRLIRRATRRNYRLAKTLGLLGLWASTHRYRVPNPLLVYQMGKVGSTTVVESLRSNVRDRPVFQVHFLTDEFFAEEDRMYREAFHRLRRVDHHVLASHYVRRSLRAQRRTRWKVVSLVRDPVARNVSSFFQVLPLRYPQVRLDGSTEAESLLGELAQLFLDTFDHDLPLTWFDRELRRSFGIDVFAQPFPKQRGYHTYRGPRTDLLVIRLESLDSVAEEAFVRFLGLEEFALAPANRARDKDYSTLYSEFVRALTLPDTYLDRMYRSRFSRNFYTEAEIEGFRKRWRRQ